eukprot:TRINITY_DN19460_c0_g1_i2.p1 TRINITY_DN19460_c0_g1~~TRINITY_DN19460_c0_g1_i2.p1  ORF type:complete len:333 (-),score=59.40 TRINITY_DN19460_c0_g1_i2:112-1110(-)
MVGATLAVLPLALGGPYMAALRIASESMLRRQVLLKDMPSLIQLGAATTIISEKTGTLTQNGMSASHAVCEFQLRPVDKYLQRDEPGFVPNNKSFECLQCCVALCVNARFSVFDQSHSHPLEEQDYEQHFHYVPHDQSGHPVSWSVIQARSTDPNVVDLTPQADEVLRWRNPDTGFRPYQDGNATEGGLMRMSESWLAQLSPSFDEVGLEDSGSRVVKYRKAWNFLGQMPFMSSTKLKISVHDVPSADNPDCRGERQRLLGSAGVPEEDTEEFVVLMMMGAQERVADMCVSALVDGKQVDPRVYHSLRRGELETGADPVSYTHLTLPTKRIV